MTSRIGIHSQRPESGTNSPRNVTYRSASRSPQRGDAQNETNPIDSDNEVDSEEDEEYITNTNRYIEGENPQKSKYADNPLPPPPPSPTPTLKAIPRAEQQKPPLSNVKRQPLDSMETKLKLNPILKYIFYAIICILPVIVGSKMYMKQPELKTCRFDQLRQRAPLQKAEVWNALEINIELLLNKRIQSPNIYLLLHSKDSSSGKIQKLIQDIAQETSKCFDGKRPIEMGLQDFQTKDDDDYGYPIEQYKNKLKDGNVFLIANLNEIPPSAARALHTICETFSPIDPDVVIFLTLSTSQVLSAGQNPTALADQTLRQLWREMPDNELGPLITRVTDQVLLLQG